MTRVPTIAIRARRLRWLSLSGLALGLALSCSKANDTQDYVPSQRGAVQPDAGGAQISEDAACAELEQAEADARADLGCAALEAVCPSYIRPAGSTGCFAYSQTSVDGCKALYQSFTGCEEFDLHPCLITAIPDSGCGTPVPGEGGAGGAPGVPVDPGAAGDTAAGAGGV
jgi:hypothetical protein